MQGMGRVEVSPPWPSFGKRRRWTCSECWQDVVRLLDQWAYERDNFDLPTDQVSGWETAGGGLRGTYSER